MTDASGGLPPAGWYPDPYGAPEERWWSGTGWTEHMNTAAPAAPVAPAEPVYEAPAQPVYEAPVEPVYEAPVFEQPSYDLPNEHTQTFGGLFPSQGEQAEQPEQAEPRAATPAPAAAFDFGFNDIIAGGSAPSASASAQPQQGAAGDDGLFGSWSPDEYDEPPTNGPATAGLTFGILSFFIPALAGLAGLILSAVGLKKSADLAKAGEGPIGRGKAIGGIITSVIGTAASLALVAYALPLITSGSLFGSSSDGATDSPLVDSSTDRTANGGIPVAVGTAATINFPDTKDAAVTFTVTKVNPAVECTADAETVLSPENGQFVAVTMEFTTSADYLTVMNGGTAMRMSSDDWIGYTADSTQVVNTDAGNSCIPEDEQLPAEFAAGQTISGTIVLDMTSDVTALSWSPSGVTGLDPGITRWEWPATAAG